MKVFISHSMKDVQLLQALQNSAASLGIQPLIAEHLIDVNNTITMKIQRMIQESDLVLVVLTRDGHDSKFVQQEIGYATDKKPILVVVEKGYETGMTGFLHGRDYVVMDPWNPSVAFVQIQQVLMAQKGEVERQEAFRKFILFVSVLVIVASLTEGR